LHLLTIQLEVALERTMARVLSTLLVVTCIASTAVGFIPSRALKAAIGAGRETSTASHFVPLARPPLKRHTRAPTVRRAGGDDGVPEPDADDYKRAEARADADDNEMNAAYDLKDDDDDENIDYSQLDALMDEIWNADETGMPPEGRATIEMPSNTEEEQVAKEAKMEEVFGAEFDEIAEDIEERIQFVEDVMVNQMGIAKKVMNETSGEEELQANMDGIPEAERWPKMLEMLKMLEAKYEITEEEAQDGYDDFVTAGWGKAIGLKDDALFGTGVDGIPEGGVQTQLDEIVKMQFDEDKKKMLQKKKKKMKKPTSDDE